MYTKVNHGVPQGSVLGQNFILIIYASTRKHYQDTLCKFPLQCGWHPVILVNKTWTCNQLTKLQACLKDIKTWMTHNFLLLNSDKRKILILDPKHLRDKLSNDIAALDDIALASNETVRNLGVIFDTDLSFNSHLKLISRIAFFHLCNIYMYMNMGYLYSPYSQITICLIGL